jgi:acetyltransferase-like isoleucine patch superfamily enzyme
MLNKGIFYYIKTVYYIIYTKLFFRKSRIVRFPIDIRGKKYIEFGNNLTTGKYCRIEAYPKDGKSKTIFFGDNIEINDFVHITGCESVIIGDNVLIAGKVYISDTAHGNYSGNEEHDSPEIIPNNRKLFYKKVEIKEKVWIGEGVSVLPGVIIGKGSIIGANSVVTKSIPDYCIAVGVPAKIVKRYNFQSKKWEKTNEKGEFINE